MELVLLFGSYVGVAVATLIVWQSTVNRSGPKYKWTHFPVNKPQPNDLWNEYVPKFPNRSTEEFLMGCDWCGRYVNDGDGRYRGEAEEYRLCLICEVQYDEAGR